MSKTIDQREGAVQMDDKEMQRRGLESLQNEIGAWGDVTFPESDRETVLAHFTEEAEELTMAAYYAQGEGYGNYQEEAADVFLLLLHLAHKFGFSLFAAAEEKMAINRARTWNTTPEPAGHFKHVEVAP